MNRKELPGRLITIGLVVVTSMVMLYGTLTYFAFKAANPAPAAAEVAEYEAYLERQNELRANAIRFGLDIQGGADVLLSIDIDELRVRRLKAIESDLRAQMRFNNVRARVRLDAKRSVIRLTLQDPGADEQAITVLNESRFVQTFESWDENALRTNKEVDLALREGPLEEEALSAIERTVELLRERIDKLGLLQPTVTTQGEDKIRIQLPGETNAEEAVESVTQLARLEFRAVAPVTPQRVDPTSFYDRPIGMIDREWYNNSEYVTDYEIVPARYVEFDAGGNAEEGISEELVERKPALEGDDVEEARLQNDPTQGWLVSLRFNRRGTTKFGKLTRDNVDRQIAIILDGEIRTAPNVNEPILTGQAVITGGFSRDEAFALVQVINTGALPVQLKVESSQVIGAQLGTDSVMKSLQALGVGAFVIVVALGIYYGGAGVVAILALLVNVLVIMGLLVLGQATLTLSGIGGILLTLGMAVDANVLIYERIREELTAGKKALDAIVSGFDSAFWTIIDANITTLITALILLQFGQGSVQGFALTMTFGIFATLFTGLFVTRTFFGVFFEGKGKAPMGTLTLFKKPRFNFLGMKNIGYAISLMVLAAGLFGVIAEGGLIPGTEFSGGVKMQVAFDDANLGTEDIKRRLAETDDELNNVDVVEVFGTTSFVITSKILEEAGDEPLTYTMDHLENAIGTAYGDGADILSEDAIGNAVGQEFTARAISALVFASLGILLYVAVRFEFWFGVAAVFALLHDVLITLGILTLLKVEITLEVVAALLVVVGYSINDTIVIFDRVRENLRLHIGRPLKELINLSINESLNRTVVTSLTTLVVILSMLLLGGLGLRYFAITLLIGLITGTYSSSFVASPLLAYFAKKSRGGLTANAGDDDAAGTPVTAGSNRPKASPKPAAAEVSEPSDETDDDSDSSVAPQSTAPRKKKGRTSKTRPTGAKKKKRRKKK